MEVGTDDPAGPWDAGDLDDLPYAAVFEHSLDGVLFTKPTGEILAANPAACAIVGLTENEVCARGRQGIADTTDPRWQTALTERRRTGRVRAVATMIHGDGTRFEAEIASTIFTGPHGDVRACVIFRDVTERVRVSALLAAKSEIAQALLAGETVADVLTYAARSARCLVGATDALVVAATDARGSIAVVAADGPAVCGLLGRRYPPGSLGAELMRAGRPVVFTSLSAAARTADGRALAIGPGIVVPIVSGERPLANLVVGTTDDARKRFTADERAAVEALAENVGMALSLGEARAEVQRLAAAAREATARRENPMSPAERDVLRYLTTHMTLPAIAQARYVSRHTIKSQVRSIYTKLGVTSRGEAVEAARALGLVEPADISGPSSG